MAGSGSLIRNGVSLPKYDLFELHSLVRLAYKSILSSSFIESTAIRRPTTGVSTWTFTASGSGPMLFPKAVR